MKYNFNYKVIVQRTATEKQIVRVNALDIETAIKAATSITGQPSLAILSVLRLSDYK